MAEQTASEIGILIVEDEPSLAEMYAKWLEQSYETITALGGEEALEMLSESVDIVLLDRRMPGLSGDEVLEQIRNQGYDVQVVMVTAVKPDFDILDMAFDAYLTKPVTLEDLEETISDMITLKAYNDTVRESYTLVEKKTALEETLFEDELKDNQEYAALKAELEEKTTQLEETAASFGPETHKQLYKRLGIETDLPE